MKEETKIETRARCAACSRLVAVRVRASDGKAVKVGHYASRTRTALCGASWRPIGNRSRLVLVDLATGRPIPEASAGHE